MTEVFFDKAVADDLKERLFFYYDTPGSHPIAPNWSDPDDVVTAVNGYVQKKYEEEKGNRISAKRMPLRPISSRKLVYLSAKRICKRL